MKDRLINVGLRGATLVSKFLLIFFLAQFLEPSDVGLYGLFFVSVSYAIYFLGGDFYVFSTREVLKSDKKFRGGLLKSQIGLSLFLYVIFLPLSLGLFVFDLIPWWLAPWFIPLLVLEHVNQEINRFLIVLNRQVVASLVLFFRSGAWALIIIFLMAVDSSYRNLEMVILSWFIGGIVAFTIGVGVIGNMGMGGWNQSVDWGWIKKGLKVAVPMLISSLALRGLFTIDRYWFEAWVGLEALGAYVLFIGIASALQSFMDAAVFSFIYPPMISAYAQDQSKVFQRKHRQMVVQSIGLTIVLSIIISLILGPLISWLNRPVYTEYIGLFYWVLVANILFLLGALPQYGLYARNIDKPIIISHLTGFCVFVFLTYILGLINKELAVPIGLLLACLYMLIYKTFAFYKLTPVDWQFKIFSER